MAEVSYWDADGHWTEWRCDLPAGPGLYRAADDEWTISDQGGLVQVITATQLVNPA